MTIRDNKELLKKTVERQKEMSRFNLENEKKDTKMLGISFFVVLLIPLSLISALINPQIPAEAIFAINLITSTLWGAFVVLFYFPKHIDRQKEYYMINATFEDEELFAKRNKIAVEPINKDDENDMLDSSHRLYATQDSNNKVLVYLVNKKDQDDKTVFDVLEKGRLLEKYRIKKYS